MSYIPWSSHKWQLSNLKMAKNILSVYYGVKSYGFKANKFVIHTIDKQV